MSQKFDWLTKVTLTSRATECVEERVNVDYIVNVTVLALQPVINSLYFFNNDFFP